MTTTGDTSAAAANDARHAAVRAAARAAADWVRARRTVWDPEPLVFAPRLPAAPVLRPEIDEEASALVPEISLAEAPPLLSGGLLPSEDEIAPPAEVEPGRAADSVPGGAVGIARPKRRRRPVPTSITAWPLFAAGPIGGDGRRRLMVAAATVLALTAGTAARGYWIRAASAGATFASEWVPKPAPAARSTPAAPAAPIAARVAGRLEIHSDPSGAAVVVDGRARGVTPLMLEGVEPGSHVVELSTDRGSIRRTVRVTAKETAQLTELVASGWISVFAPFDLVIRDGATVVEPDDRGQILLAPGPHAIRFGNRELGYDETRRVTVRPGEVQAVSLTPPRSRLTVTASEAADVWVDGAPAGPAPIQAAPIDLGTREIVVTNAGGDQRRFVIVATVKPVELDVQF